jgi:DNA repair protein RecO
MNQSNINPLACQAIFHDNRVMSISTAGILLQVIPYLGRKKILKIFTPEQGLISLFTSNTQLVPFSLAEWVYRKSEREMHSLQDASLIDPLLHLKEEYATLIAAGGIARDLLRTQLPGKKAVELFDLTLFYLNKLSTAPEILAASFRLKLLLHEGLLNTTPHPSFTEMEWKEIEILAFSRKLSEILHLQQIPRDKIDLFFEERIGV